MPDSDFDESVLSNMTYYIAVNYQKLMHSTSNEEQVKLILHIYRLSLHTLAIIMVSQYLIQDKATVHHPGLNRLLLDRFPAKMTVDAWENVLFTSVEVYKDNRQLLFLPELCDAFWHSIDGRQQPREQVKRLFTRLTTIALEQKQDHFIPQSAQAWKALATDLLVLLRQLLTTVSFLKNYELVRVLDFDNESYSAELYKGVHITTVHDALPSFARLNRGLFYLRNEMNGLLLLHPLLIFWDDEYYDDEMPYPATGLYDRYANDRLRYLTTLSGDTRPDERSKIVQAFVNLVYSTIEDTKIKRQEAERLTWLEFREIAADISLHRMDPMRHKYKEALYLERAKVHNEFMNFLESDKHGFVLIGKSGVGKSNFLMALRDELHASRSDICLLMYDGAQIGEGTSISEVIAQDFNNLLVLAGTRIEDIWQVIAQIDGVNEQLVILCIDAINESSQAKGLLRQLDELVLTRRPWLKVVFSSRPETWRAMRSNIPLTDSAYYTEAGSNVLEVGLEPFSYSERMEPFSRSELREAYTKYKDEFHLQTEFAQLSVTIREVLREPLNLWLVASTYHHGQIPNTIQIVELVERYVDGLLASGRLEPEDVRLLEKRLVPLMVRPAHYSNVVTSEDIDTVGDDLFEALYSAQVLSDGRRINKSFTNLIDLEILVWQQGTRDQKFGFKYERFYEYFVGRRLLDLSQSESDLTAFFRRMVGQTSTTPFLWGAIRNALIHDFLLGDAETVRSLCYTDQQRVKEMMADMLTTIGHDELGKVAPVLIDLVSSGSDTRQRLLNRSRRTTDADTSARYAAKIAVEVASSLGVTNVLKIAALQKDAAVRTAAVRYAYRFWNREQNEGFGLLEQLAHEATKSLIPNFTAFDSTMGLSAVIFFDHVHDDVVLKRLQGIWHGVISKLLAIRESGGTVSRLTRNFVRERLMSVALSIAFKLLRDLPDYNVFTYERLEAFFRLDAESKATYVRISTYLDPRISHTLEEMRADLMAAFRIRHDVLVTSVCHMVLALYAVENPHDSLPLLQDLLDVALSDTAPNGWVSVIPIILEALLDHYPLDEAIFDMFIRVVKVNHSYYSSEFGRPGLMTTESPESAYLGTYIYFQSMRSASVQTDWLRSCIDAALERGDMAFFRSFFTTHLPIVGIERSKPRPALDALALVFHRGIPEIDQLSLRFLARLRAYYPDEVDTFLEDQRASDDVILQIRTNEPVEKVGELIGLRAFRFFRDDVIIGSVALRQQFARAFVKAAECKNTREWINYLIREAVNLVYGDEALPQTR